MDRSGQSSKEQSGAGNIEGMLNFESPSASTTNTLDSLLDITSSNTSGAPSANYFDTGSPNALSTTMYNFDALDQADFNQHFQDTGSATHPNLYNGVPTTDSTEHTSAAQNLRPAGVSHGAPGRGMLGAYGAALRDTPARTTGAQNGFNGRHPKNVQARAQRGRPRGVGPRHRPMSTNATITSAAGHLPARSGSAARFVGAADLKTGPDSSAAALGQNGGPEANSFARPAHHELNSTRITNAGPDLHPDASWRAPGAHQWVEILHDYTLLRYLSTAVIREIEKHCEKLVRANSRAGSSTPALVENGPYHTTDAQAVWNYCAAYVKRRAQLTNNMAASRSRAVKAATLKHWKALALAAGFPDQEFEHDVDDPGNAADTATSKNHLLSAVTQNAIDDFYDARSSNPSNHPGSHRAAAPSASVPHNFDAPGQQYQFPGSVQGQQRASDAVHRGRGSLASQSSAHSGQNVRRSARLLGASPSGTLPEHSATFDIRTLAAPSDLPNRPTATAAAPAPTSPSDFLQNGGADLDLSWRNDWLLQPQSNTKAQRASPLGVSSLDPELEKLLCTNFDQ
ncbi:unnamed protein product [Discula destructiva]